MLQLILKNIIYDRKKFYNTGPWRSFKFVDTDPDNKVLQYLAMEVLLKGKAKYGSPPRTNQFRSAPCYIENIIYFKKTGYLNEEVNRTEPSASVSVP